MLIILDGDGKLHSKCLCVGEEPQGSLQTVLPLYIEAHIQVFL